MYASFVMARSRFQLTQKFVPLDWAPERLLFKHLFGTYETFLGDVRIYECE